MKKAPQEERQDAWQRWTGAIIDLVQLSAEDEVHDNVKKILRRYFVLKAAEPSIPASERKMHENALGEAWKEDRPHSILKMAGEEGDVFCATRTLFGKDWWYRENETETKARRIMLKSKREMKKAPQEERQDVCANCANCKQPIELVDDLWVHISEDGKWTGRRCSTYAEPSTPAPEQELPSALQLFRKKFPGFAEQDEKYIAKHFASLWELTCEVDALEARIRTLEAEIVFWDILCAEHLETIDKLKKELARAQRPKA